MIHGSFGTLGILTQADVPARPGEAVRAARLREVRARSTTTSAAIKRHFDAQDVDFMDGIIHSPDKLRAVRRPLRRRGAVHAQATTGRRSTTRAPATRLEDYLDDAGLLLPLRPRRHERASEVVARPAARRQADGLGQRRCASPTSSTSCSRPTSRRSPSTCSCRSRRCPRSSSWYAAASSASSRCGACRTSACTTTSGSTTASTRA